MKKFPLSAFAALAALAAPQAGAQSQDGAPALLPLTAIEFQRRLQFCLDTEEWLREACLETLQRREVVQIQAPDAPDTPLGTQSASNDIDELHLVSVYQPHRDRGSLGAVRRGAVNVVVDRPGQSVALVFNSYEPVLWSITTSPGTEVAHVVISGHGRDRTEVRVNGQPIQVERAVMPLAFSDEGAVFHAFHRAAYEHFGLEQADSFHGAYTAPEEGFAIASAPGLQTHEAIMSAVFAAARDRATLPAPLRAALDAEATQVRGGWQFGNRGFTRTDGGVGMAYPAPLDMPEISWPMGVAHDPANNLLWGITLGGEGFLYEYDIGADRWSAWSMRNFDAGGLIFDAARNRLIATPGPNRARLGGSYLTLDRQARVVASVEVPASAYPGLMETLDHESARGASFRPLAIHGDELLVSSAPRLAPPNRTLQATLFYVVNLSNGTVELVR